MDDQAAPRPAPLLAGTGLALVGAGLSIAVDAASRRAAGGPWFLQGTAGLVVLGSGLSVLGDAVRRVSVHQALTARRH